MKVATSLTAGSVVFALAFFTPGVAPGAGHPKTFKPARAQADADAVMQERTLSFCREPEKPLSVTARALCPHAAAIPNCAGFAQACVEKEPDPEESFLKKFFQKLASYTPDFVKRALGALAKVPAIVFLALVLAIVLAALLAVVRSFRAARRDASLRAPRKGAERRRPEARPRPALTHEEALLARAGERARAGENDVALQLYLAASLRALDRRGAVRWAKNRTNGEYVRSCLEENSRAPLREIVGEVDRVQFGRSPATVGVVARAADLATGIVRWLPILALVLALPDLAGCGNFHLPRPGQDPAGTELFEPWLKRQEVDTEPLDQPLESVDDPPAGQRHAILIDLETTEIDDETKTHLVQWVEKGGTLVLAGLPDTWPEEFGAKSHDRTWTTPKVVARAFPDGATFTGALANPAAFEFAEAGGGEEDEDAKTDASGIAFLDDGATYAATTQRGLGTVIGIASDELLRNAALARPGSAAVLAAILSHAGVARFAIAAPEDGSAGSSSPLNALIHAGLGLALVHALAAAAILFLAAGIRLRAPKPTAPRARRAFVEHVVAVGALYARARAARHALTVYAHFVEQRLRARMPRGATDVPAFLAARARMPLDVCQRLWSDVAASGRIAPRTELDDLRLLKELGEAHAAATAQDR